MKCMRVEVFLEPAYQSNRGHTSEGGYELNFRLRCKNDGVMVSSALFKNSRAYHNTIICGFHPANHIMGSWEWRQ